MRKAMKVLAGLTLVAALPSFAATPGTQPKWVTGYYGGYFWDNADYQKPEHVDMTALTHFVFARIGPGGGKSGQPGEVVPGAGNAHDNRDVGPGAAYDWTVEEFLVKRAHQANIKALIMLGGEGDNAGFLASTAPAVRPAFVKNLVDYMVAKDYDGIDVDWEGLDSKNPDEAALLEALVIDLRKEANGRPRYHDRPVIITYPAGNINTNIDKVTPHDVRMAGLVDQYNFMSYGVGWFGQGWASNTFSPLTGHTPSRPVSIAGTIQAYVDAGVPRAKLGMGIGFYGANYAPPFTGPDQETDGDLGKWSVLDYRWSYTMLHKYGYLDKGIYAWDAPTQTSYRAYPGGYTPVDRPDWSSGYISYEEPATIAAKGAWAQSTRDGEGAAGTIIWLVNYGTTDGVDNPLLTAVKQAFLDPTATEPGPYPNPLPPPPPLDLETRLDASNDWGTGYCGTLTVTNVGATAGYWSTTLPFKDKLTSLWNAQYTLENGVLGLQGPAYDRKLRPGQSTQVGLCATRPATPAEPPPPPPAGAVTAQLVITADWTSGYCAKVAVTNNSAVKVAGWTVDVANVQGTLSGLWNGRYTMDGTTMHLSGPDWNRDLAAGGTNDDAGFCASR
ncbi:glycosyl hydrolase family 18 protein [Telluria sp. Tellsp104]